MKTMSNDVRKEFDKAFEQFEEKEYGVMSVFNKACKFLVGSYKKNMSAEALLYLSLVGENKESPARMEYFEAFMNHMSWYKENGSDKKILCDFVEVEPSKLDGLNLAIREYRMRGIKSKGVYVEFPIVKPDACVGHVEDKRVVKKEKEFVIVHESGYKEKIKKTMKDEKGIELTEEKVVLFVPRAKSVFALDYVKDVMIAALEDIAK